MNRYKFCYIFLPIILLILNLTSPFGVLVSKDENSYTNFVDNYYIKNANKHIKFEVDAICFSTIYSNTNLLELILKRQLTLKEKIKWIFYGSESGFNEIIITIKNNEANFIKTNYYKAIINDIEQAKCYMNRGVIATTSNNQILISIER